MNMTEPEVMEMVNLYAGNAMSSFSLWVSFTFAYLTVAYLVGTKLSNVQLYIVSSLYIITGGGFALAAVTYTQSFTALNSTYPDFRPTELWLIPWTLFSSAMLIGGMLASLYFMWDIRHPKPE
jgi:hypothetical protein